MKTVRTLRRIAPLAMVATLLLTATAFAQQGPPPGGGGGFGGGGRGGQRGGGFGGGQFGFGQQRELTLINVPLAVMTPALNLSADQQTRIKAIQDDLQQKREDAMGGFGGPGGPGGRGQGGGQDGPPPGGQGDQGGPPPGGGGGFGFGNREEMQQRMQEMQQKMQELQATETKSNRAIEQLLSDSQKTALTPAMREWKIVQQMGLPLEVASELKLTEEQKTILEKQFKARNTGGRGGRQGGGGFGGGGFGGGGGRPNN